MGEEIPLYCFDNTHFLKSMVMRLTVRFEDVLNVDELHKSLALLLKLELWRKLGGRLHSDDDDDDLKTRIFKRYSLERPAIKFTEAHHHMLMGDHPLMSNMLHTTNSPSMHPGVEELRPLCSDGTDPTTFKEYTSKDRPQISLHVTTFTDATLVSLTWPHTMTDAMGWSSIFKAWSAFSNNHIWSIPMYMGYDMDTLEQFGFDEDVEPSVQEPERRNLTAVPATLARQVSNAFHEPKMESRVFCIPEGVLKLIDYKTTSTMSSFTDATRTDVIKGWATNIICSHMGTSNRRVCIHSFFDLRERLPGRFPTQGSFIQNATFPYVTQIPAKDLVQGAFGDTAAALRRSFMLQGQPDQLAASAKQLRTSGMRDKYQVQGDPDGHHIYFVDWSETKLLEATWFFRAVEEPMKCHSNNEADVDAITPADKRPDTRSKVEKGKGVYFQTDIMSKSDLHGQNVFTLYGSDANGDYWFGAVLHKKEMKNLEDEIVRLQSGAVP